MPAIWCRWWQTSAELRSRQPGAILNGGYYLLGAVIESASGQSYRDFVAQHIFKALGMRNSGFERTGNAAMSLTRMTGPGQPPAANPQPRMEFPEFKASSAGDAFSSAADLKAFANALQAEAFLTDAIKSEGVH